MRQPVATVVPAMSRQNLGNRHSTAGGESFKTGFFAVARLKNDVSYARHPDWAAFRRSLRR
ncbi:MAG: hypothetical protein C0483_08360 [Pirellula sp.]|nr:hypothetical protein [Pirellula sp.]